MAESIFLASYVLMSAFFAGIEVICTPCRNPSKTHRSLFYLAALTFLGPLADAHAAERILRMDVVASIRQDSSVIVTEEIEFVSEGIDIQRGLIRSIPVDYRIDGRLLKTGFNLMEARLDGRATPYRLARNGSDVEIRLGDPDRLLAVGRHTYLLRYETTRQVVFFEDHDELYWNVTGNDWEFPIDKASYRVELPGGAAVDAYDAYTGFYGQSGKDFVFDGGTFRTTRPLGRREGFSVAVGWPKGVVAEPPPSFMEKYGLHILFLSLAAMIGWYVFAWLRWGRDPSAGTIIPLFEPPEGMEPSDTRLVAKRLYDEESLAGDILQLAVRGAITIEESGGRIVLRKKDDVSFDAKRLSGKLSRLMEGLFRGGEQIDLSAEDDGTLRRIHNLFLGETEDLSLYYTRNIPQLILGILFPAAGVAAVAYGDAWQFGTEIWMGFVGTALLAFVAAAFALPAYTLLGRNLLDRIDGLKLYLKTAEKHRLEALYPAVKDKVPEQTPQLFERFLPYAVALDTAQTWGDSFASLLKTSPSPDWYSGSSVQSWDFLTQRMLVNSLGRSRAAWRSREAERNRAQSKSSGSGLGGGGFSGGGRGGGGGRGW